MTVNYRNLERAHDTLSRLKSRKQGGAGLFDVESAITEEVADLMVLCEILRVDISRMWDAAAALSIDRKQQ